ncbi:Aldo-ket-red domain-containing protein [Mycena indigotica]|uniref:Aldo-ket-red domain-containing protein n=1 Tax=Mycena indigotica TaxID=2126181 RepID=A0A8H6VQN6_9AGAR|nr:Aldo-ket-red domain-containing protein [Mycena indigotica]KAF7288481.1 Aldo-ket-red domain-containing protein [Mycena indigotica]
MRVAWWVKECCGRQCGAAAVQRLESSGSGGWSDSQYTIPSLVAVCLQGAHRRPPPAGTFIAQSTGLRLDGELSSSETNSILNSCPHLQDVVILPRGLIFSTADVLGTLPNLRRLTTNLLSLYMMTASPDLSALTRITHLHLSFYHRWPQVWPPLLALRALTHLAIDTKEWYHDILQRDAPPLDMLLDVLSDPHRRLNVFVLSYQRVGKVPLDERLIEHPACLLVHQGIGWPEWQDEWTGGATSAGFWERVDKMLAERRSAGAPGKYDNDCAFNLLSSVKHTKSTVCGTPSTASRRTLYASATSWNAGVEGHYTPPQPRGNAGVDWWPGTSGWCRLLSYTSADKSRARTADTAEGPTAKKAVCQRDPNPQREGLHRPDAPPRLARDVLLTRDGPGGDRFGKPYRGWWYILFVQGRCSVKPSSGVSERRPRDERMMWWKSGAAGAFPAASCALDIRLPVSELVFRFAIGDSEPEGDLWSWIHILDLAMLVKFTWCIDKRLLSLARLSREDVVFPRVRHLVLRIQNSLVLTHSGIEQLPHLPGTRTAMAASEPACVLPCVRELTTACKVLPAVLPCTPFVNKLKIWNEAAGRLLFTLQRIERYIPPTITNVALQSDNGNYSLWSGILAFFPNLRTLDFRVKESSGDSRPSEAPHFLASLSTILPPTLESLRVHIWSSRAVLPGGQTGRVGLSRLPSADELQAELLKGASRSRDGLRRSIWRGLSNPSLFAGESDTQGGGLYWAETSGVKSAADGPDGKQQGTTRRGQVAYACSSFSRSTAPTDGAPPSADTTGPFARRCNRFPFHSSPPAPMSSPVPVFRRKSDALPPVGPQRSARAALLSRRLSGSPSEAPSSARGVKDIMQAAFENGINMFDTAEDYQKGAAEREMGHAIKELGWRRTDLVISTKIFWSHEPGTGPNDTGLSHKHVIEGTKACLRRLQMDYVDVIFAHRCDTTVPMEEIVRAFNYVIDQGWAFYWGTSQWSAPDRGGASCCHALKPHRARSEQCKHNMFHRERPEKEYTPLYAKYGLGTTAFSALQGGLLTGKYNDGIPDGTRFATVPMFPWGDGGQIAAGASFLPDLLNSGRNPLALAWVAAHRHTSTVILGVSSVAQLEANLGALEVLPKLDAAVLARIEAVLGNHPQEPETYGRPPLDQGIL